MKKTHRVSVGDIVVIVVGDDKEQTFIVMDPKSEKGITTWQFQPVKEQKHG